MSTGVSLGRLQRWMQAVIVHPGSVEEAVSTPPAEAEIPAGGVRDVILPSRTLTSVERLGIYHGMYLLRMREALESDYPALLHFLGADAFTRLVRDYVARYPSTSYTLNRLGEHLPDFILTASGIPRRAFCHDLARLEWAVTTVFDAPASPTLTEESVAAVPAGGWEQVRLRPIDAFRLLSFGYPVNAYLQSVRADEHEHPRPKRKDTWVAVYRQNYGIRRLDIERPAFELLSALAEGRPLGEAVASVMAGVGRRRVREADLFEWFRQWVAGGLFQSVSI